MAELVLVAGRDATGAVLRQDAFETPAGGGVTAVDASARVADAVLQVQADAAAAGHDVHAIGFTWADEAATEAAVVLERLTDTGLGNVVPVRFHQAVEAAQLLGPVGPTLAHGAALVSTRDATFPAVALTEAPPATVTDSRPSPQSLQYAGALAMLIVGALTFVMSLSLAVSLQNTPDRELGPIERVASTTEPTAERSATPAPPTLDVPAAQELGEPAVLPDEPAEP